MKFCSVLFKVLRLFHPLKGWSICSLWCVSSYWWTVPSSCIVLERRERENESVRDRKTFIGIFYWWLRSSHPCCLPCSFPFLKLRRFLNLVAQGPMGLFWVCGCLVKSRDSSIRWPILRLTHFDTNGLSIWATKIWSDGLSTCMFIVAVDDIFACSPWCGSIAMVFC